MAELDAIVKEVSETRALDEEHRMRYELDDTHIRPSELANSPG